MDAPRVLALLRGELNASDLWRDVQPLTELANRGYYTHYAQGDATGDLALSLADRVYNYDAIVLSRATYYPRDLPLLYAMKRGLRARGKALLYSCDDDMWLHPDQQLAAPEDAAMLERNRLSVHTLRACDGVIVSTRRLQTIVGTLTDAPVAVVPNLIDLAWFRAVQAQAERTVRGLTIGWAGAKRADADLVAVAEAWRRVAAARPRVRFVVQGHAPELLTRAVPAGRLHVVPWLALEAYPLGLVNVDIACCAVAFRQFSLAKSNIKAQEFGARGRTAVVATPLLYRDIIRPGDTGLLAETADEWEAALLRLVDDAAYRRALARRLGRAVEREWSLGRHAERWLVAWDWLIREARARWATEAA